MDHDRLGRNDKIGQLVLGSKSGSMEVKHWNEMFAKSRQAVPKWHVCTQVAHSQGLRLIVCDDIDRQDARLSTSVNFYTNLINSTERKRQQCSVYLIVVRVRGGRDSQTASTF